MIYNNKVYLVNDNVYTKFGLNRPQHFSHYKSMGIFQFAQLQLEWPQSFFSIITLWELSVGMETRVPILPGPKLNEINPPPK